MCVGHRLLGSLACHPFPYSAPMPSKLSAHYAAFGNASPMCLPPMTPRVQGSSLADYCCFSLLVFLVLFHLPAVRRFYLLTPISKTNKGELNGLQRMPSA